MEVSEKQDYQKIKFLLQGERGLKFYSLQYYLTTFN